MVEDATITATVKSKMLWSRYVEGIKANVDTARGKVTLTGSADSTEAKDFAAKNRHEYPRRAFGGQPAGGRLLRSLASSHGRWAPISPTDGLPRR
jgi:hypothetical protein